MQTVFNAGRLFGAGLLSREISQNNLVSWIIPCLLFCCLFHVQRLNVYSVKYLDYNLRSIRKIA
jgi:hypothetical protein